MSDYNFEPASLKQSWFLSSDANIIVYGGAMGGGKTYCGLLRHLRWIDDPHYRGYVVRKQQTSVMATGGIFDEAYGLYKAFDENVKPNKKAMTFTFPSGAVVAMGHCETNEDAEKWRGRQVSACMVDEATQLLEDHVLVILSRLRSKAKMIPNLFLTCNPSPDSFIRRWIDWWLIPKGEENAGRADPKKDGKIRWFIRQNNEMIWADTKQELLDTYGSHVLPLSLQFISATIYDNPPLIKSNPGYLANLQGLKRVKQERDLYGNWDIREEASGYFKLDWLGEPINPYDMDIVKRVRAWDLAGSLPSEVLPNPDWTAGVLMAKTRSGLYIIEDVIRFRGRYGEVIQKIIETAKSDPEETQIVLPQEPGQAGKSAGLMMVKALIEEGFSAKLKSSNKSKITRFMPVASAAEAGLVRYAFGSWNDTYFSEMEAFNGDRANKDDQVDATSDAFITLAERRDIPSFAVPINTKSNEFRL
jgi:predicted phage terminase large subunit-like protein